MTKPFEFVFYYSRPFKNYRFFLSGILFWLSLSFATVSSANECSSLINKDDRKMCPEILDKNVLGGKLALCCENPKAGFYRNGLCQTGAQDAGTHVACAIMSDEFLEFTKGKGNDLITPKSEYSFPGLKAGDKWCLCASRWAQALEAGIAPKLILEATHEKMREYADIDVLKKYAFLESNDTNAPLSKAGAYQFSFTTIDGEPMPLLSYAGQVMLIVNTASQCGFTKQYKVLQALYERYQDKGFVVIGVPCNQFGGQEPGSEAVIKDFAQKEYGITFPLTSKINVSGKNAHPFFTWASAEEKGAFFQSSPKWNFHKFLVDRKGQLIKSYGSHIGPDDKSITSEIEKLLSEKP